MNHPVSSNRPVTLFLRLAAALIIGGGAGGAALLLTFLLMGPVSGTADVAYSLGGGVACLVIGTITWLSLRPPGFLSRFVPLLVALLLGTGLALLTLGVFWWLQRGVFVYSQHPNLNYLLGEVGGYLAPGLGLLTCGLVLVWSYPVRPHDEGTSSARSAFQTSFSAASRPRRPILGFLLRLALAAILGGGAGLLSGTLPYLLHGKRGSTSEVAGFLASGAGAFFTGVALWRLCARTGSLPWLWRVTATLLLLTGVVLCGIGIAKWLPYYKIG